MTSPGDEQRTSRLTSRRKRKRRFMVFSAMCQVGEKCDLAWADKVSGRLSLENDGSLELRSNDRD